MIVFVLIILIVVLLKNIISEGYSIWNSNPHLRYGKYKVKQLVNRYGRTKKTNNIKKYTVVYMPQNNRTVYNRMSGSYTK